MAAAVSWSIEPAGIADREVLERLVRNYHGDAGIALDDAQRRRAIQTLLDDPRAGTLWLIRCARELAGYVLVSPGFSLEFGGFDAFVDELYLLPDYRGAGGGGCVLKLLKAAVRDAGIRALHLEVERTNERARALYEKAGFRPRERYVLMTLEL